MIDPYRLRLFLLRLLISCCIVFFLGIHILVLTAPDLTVLQKILLISAMDALLSFLGYLFADCWYYDNKHK